MKFPLYTRVALAKEFPLDGLRRGDVGTVVEQYEAPAGGERGYEVEVFNAVGETIAVITVLESQIEPLRKDEVLAVRARVPIAA